jgi:hypothetical protein
MTLRPSAVLFGLEEVHVRCQWAWRLITFFHGAAFIVTALSRTTWRRSRPVRTVAVVAALYGGVTKPTVRRAIPTTARIST